MGHSVTLGGERVGSGNKSKVYLRNYERSTHNLSYDWLSTMGCGMLIPFMCELVTRDDKYEINLNAGLRTIPTKGPLFGSFKMQLDVYQCPLRLYQALLHNNPLAIGLKANQVKFPKIRLYDSVSGNSTKESKSSNNSLIKYLGISGMGTLVNTDGDLATMSRDLFGAHVLAYYDIFKNYYANKQEEYAYTLYTDNVSTGVKYECLSNYASANINTSGNIYRHLWGRNQPTVGRAYFTYSGTHFDSAEYNENSIIGFGVQYENADKIDKKFILNSLIKIKFCDANEENETNESHTLQTWLDKGIIQSLEIKDNFITMLILGNPETDTFVLGIELPSAVEETTEEVLLSPFKLNSIDNMRYEILSFHNLGQSFVLDGDGDDALDEPYYSALGDSAETKWKQPLGGICVKTYQSDIFNNWLNTEIIDGENGVAAITAISTSSGSITIDQLQFSEKLYNLLNRIAVSGGTYQDYLDAAYTASAKRFEESPMWIGGMSDEVVFEEIVQTAPAGEGVLGSLGGRGNLLGKQKGGRITVKIDEPSLLIGIVSLTPRIVYTQGNKWFNTEIDSLQDIHVPALDAIGFQNLMAETMHFGSTVIEDGVVQDRPIVGKIPAWLHYMTNYDQAYGDFAATDGDGYMVLNRNYECVNGELQDATTYIDPAKFNYAFGYTKREAQNFWMKIKCNIKARRLMSAKQIPTA